MRYRRAKNQNKKGLSLLPFIMNQKKRNVTTGQLVMQLREDFLRIQSGEGGGGDDSAEAGNMAG